MWFEGAERSLAVRRNSPQNNSKFSVTRHGVPRFPLFQRESSFESVLSAEPLTNLPRVEVKVSSQIRAFSGNHSPFPRVSWACSAR